MACQVVIGRGTGRGLLATRLPPAAGKSRHHCSSGRPWDGLTPHRKTNRNDKRHTKHATRSTPLREGSEAATIAAAAAAPVVRLGIHES
jgi:hypothetical protein